MGWTLPFLLLAQVLPSCGSDEEGKACNPGDLRACPCTGEGPSTQTCNEEGSGYDQCACGTASANGGSGGGGGSGGSGGGAMSNAGSTGMTPSSPFPRGVGAPCGVDADCAGAPLVCASSASSGILGPGGPPNGYCTLPCSGDADCVAVDEVSLCNAATRQCYAACLPGNNQAKCRAGQACLSVVEDNSFGACLPRCNSDADCDGGRVCDPGASGTCVDVRPPGGAVGDPCTLATQATDCASGFCVPYANASGFGCGAYCTFGLVDGCGFDDAGGGVREAFCFEPRFPGGAVRDLGVCFPLCDTTADCAQAGAGWVCEPIPEAAIATQLGRSGECLPGALSTSPQSADAGPG